MFLNAVTSRHESGSIFLIARAAEPSSGGLYRKHPSFRTIGFTGEITILFSKYSGLIPARVDATCWKGRDITTTSACLTASSLVVPRQLPVIPRSLRIAIFFSADSSAFAGSRDPRMISCLSEIRSARPSPISPVPPMIPIFIISHSGFLIICPWERQNNITSANIRPIPLMESGRSRSMDTTYTHRSLSVTVEIIRIQTGKKISICVPYKTFPSFVIKKL